MLAPNIIEEKKGKFRGAFFQMIKLYRTEKNEAQAKNLERLWQEYEADRFKKEQHYREPF